jgi:hypothetical protein
VEADSGEAMILEHGLDDLTAKWNPDKNTYDIGQRKRYRWCDVKNTPESEWFNDISDALVWIVEHDIARDAAVGAI